jgi:hypothetical protein
MAVKMCTRCGACDKAPGKQKCQECLMLEQAPEVQEMDAIRRRNCVPEAMRRARVPNTEWPVGRRWCADCQSFRRTSDCTGSRCTVCLGVANQDAYLRRTYTIHGRPFTAEDFQRLFKEQGGRCRICRRPSITKRLAVDHDHGSNEVRGLLCPGEWGCNLGVLGHIRDLDMAREIVAYLESNYAHSVIKE